MMQALHLTRCARARGLPVRLTLCMEGCRVRGGACMHHACYAVTACACAALHDSSLLTPVGLARLHRTQSSCPPRKKNEHLGKVDVCCSAIHSCRQS